MKTLQKHTRPLSVKEIKTLNKIRAGRESEVNLGFKLPRIVAAVILSMAAMYGAVWTRYDVVTFALGVLSVFSLVYAVIMPYDRYKELKKARSIIRNIDGILKAGVVEVTPVTARRIAVAREYEDEGDLYIVEMENNHVLYLWDTEYNLHKNFPCLQFEIYSDEFFNVVGRQINPLSEKIKPVVIDEKAKQNYPGKAAPQHLEIQKKDFDKLVEKMASHA